MVVQAFMDDSASDRTKGGDYFVLAGHVATAKQWANFAKEWESLLSWAPMGPNGIRRFKMSEMGTGAESLEKVAAFYRVIEDNVICSMSVRMRLSALANAKARIFIPGLNMKWSFFKSPFNVAFKTLLDNFHSQKPTFAPEIPANEPVDFIFDDQSEKGQIFEIWDAYLASRDEAARKEYGATPRFENDEKFLPLQAADLWAGAVRRWSDAGEWERLHRADFGSFRAKREYHFKLDMEITEDDLVKSILQTINAAVPGAIAYDLDLSVPRPTGVA